MTGINAGRLKKRIEIWRYVAATNALNASVKKLEKVKTVFGEIRPVRGSDFLEYYKELHELSYKITIRYLADLRPTDVLVWNGRQFLINSIINPEESNYILEVMCTEKNEKRKPEVQNGFSI